MRRVALVLLMTFGFGAFANQGCPDLTGNYFCEMDGEQWETTIDQVSNNDGTTSYYTDGELYAVTDGQTRSIPADDSFRNGSTRATCSDSKLIVEVEGEIYDSGQKQGVVEVEIESRIEGTQLFQRQIGQFHAVDGNTYPFNVLMTCHHY